MSYAGKRLLDLFVTVPVLILFTPFILLIMFLVRIQMGSPIFFKQQRPGLYGKPFTIYKFRTMTEARDNEKRQLPDAERLTEIGRFLRSTSLDELPELLNVVKGEMSLVGPRPLLMQYVDFYTPEQARRHEVRPGLTGWAQINGRNTISWEEKFKLDVWYVDNCSFFLDLKIIFLTVGKVFRRQSISHDGHATMPEFRGGNTPKQ